ncbi:hypothetical protein F4809DRAFT_590432 [Biscogniauxia mediterranea]|nr:hypothetical protein F4809DRAFT_590432 [Biscogniauxia mediterranea]
MPLLVCLPVLTFMPTLLHYTIPTTIELSTTYLPTKPRHLHTGSNLDARHTCRHLHRVSLGFLFLSPRFSSLA